MKLKNLVAIIIVGSLGYLGYTYLVTNFSSEAMVYKRYADALLDGEPSRIKQLVTGQDVLFPFQAREQREDFLNGEVRFTWYNFKNKVVSPDGNTVTLTVVQNVRVDPPGTDSFYGKEVRSDRHVVTLKKFQSSWQISSFADTPTAEFKAEQSAKQ
ncbi:hypothetical protein [Cerasicoccus maritimus]|uniref:hypothetical protein n=1 Tax=Cerasicoccus maritimus TaxID=490089 RepID=UPI0028525CA1|nr:hypothetical protein [Cerasicoccus maritimus]